MCCIKVLLVRNMKTELKNKVIMLMFAKLDIQFYRNYTKVQVQYILSTTTRNPLFRQFFKAKKNNNTRKSLRNNQAPKGASSN